MKLLSGFHEPSAYRGGFIAIGNFDGVHRGHQSMIEVLVEHARREAVPAVVLTFDPHPIRLLRPDHAPPSLSTVARKAELLGQMGVDCVIAYPTDRALMNLSPDEFFSRIVVGELNARGLVEGPNFFFGRDRAGDIETLKSLCDASGMLLEIVIPVKQGELLVSSSTIRSRIIEGDIAKACGLLGHPYRIRGEVVAGALRGRTIGFPTANLERVETLLPADGVYAGIGYVDDVAYPAAIHLGANPTFDDESRKLEVHLVGFSGALYGRLLDVDFLDRLRPTIRFADVEQLKAQLKQDVQAACEFVERFSDGSIESR